MGKWIEEKKIKHFFFLHKLFLEGCGVSNSRLTRHTSRSTNTDCISLGWSLKRFQPRSSIQSSHLVHGLPTSLFPLTSAYKVCLENCFLAILLTWPNHRRWDLSILRSSESISRDSRIEVFVKHRNTFDFWQKSYCRRLHIWSHSFGHN